MAVFVKIEISLTESGNGKLVPLRRTLSPCKQAYLVSGNCKIKLLCMVARQVDKEGRKLGNLEVPPFDSLPSKNKPKMPDWRNEIDRRAIKFRDTYTVDPTKYRLPRNKNWKKGTPKRSSNVLRTRARKCKASMSLTMANSFR